MRLGSLEVKYWGPWELESSGRWGSWDIKHIWAIGVFRVLEVLEELEVFWLLGGLVTLGVVGACNKPIK